MKKKRLLLILVLIFALAGGGIFFYANDYYRAGDEAAETFASGEWLTKNATVFRPAEPTSGDAGEAEPVAGGESAGLIFYPGGKVAVEAYAPLMQKLADEGMTCVLLEMPLNLAVLDSKAAEGIREMIPDVERWYIGGHSLGGAMASSYAGANPDELEGLVLLAAYSTENLVDSGLEVVSIYGSEDLVLNREKYQEYRTNLPEDTVEVIIEGGNHAQFGDYGPQDGDGTATIDVEEQWNQTVQAIVSMICGEM